MYVLICDKNEYYTEKAKKRLEELSRIHNINLLVDCVKKGDNILFFEDTKYADLDLIYIDLNLPEEGGMEIAKKLRAKGIKADIVFYAKDESGAVEGYDVEALHYIVKEKTTQKKFDEIFLKAYKRAINRKVEVISLSCAGVHKNIPISEILYFSVYDRITTVHYGDVNNKEEFEFYSSLSKIQEFLYGKGFIRIHSSYLVAKKFVRSKTIDKVELVNGEVLPIGRTYRSSVKKWD